MRPWLLSDQMQRRLMLLIAFGLVLCFAISCAAWIGQDAANDKLAAKAQATKLETAAATKANADTCRRLVKYSPLNYKEHVMLGVYSKADLKAYLQDSGIENCKKILSRVQK